MLVRCLGGLIAAVVGVAACQVDSGITPPADRLRWLVPDYFGQGFPASDSLHVYFTTRHHMVVAVQRTTGVVRWTQTLPVDHPVFFGEGVLAKGGRVFVADEDIFALDGATGAVLWRFRPADSRNTGVFMPALAGDWLITGSTNGHVFAVSQSTGEEVWRTKVVLPDTVTMYRPQVDADVVAVGFTDYMTTGGGVARGGVAVLELASGRVRWTRYLPIAMDTTIANGVLSPVIVDDAVVIGSWDGPAYAFELGTREMRWMSPGVGSGDQIRGLRPVATDGTLAFVGSSAGMVQALDPQTGELRWSSVPVTFANASTIELTAANGRLYWTLGGGQFEVRNASSGSVQWVHTSSPNTLGGGPVDDGEMIFVAGSDGLAALWR